MRKYIIGFFYYASRLIQVKFSTGIKNGVLKFMSYLLSIIKIFLSTQQYNWFVYLFTQFNHSLWRKFFCFVLTANSISHKSISMRLGQPLQGHFIFISNKVVKTKRIIFNA